MKVASLSKGKVASLSKGIDMDMEAFEKQRRSYYNEISNFCRSLVELDCSENELKIKITERPLDYDEQKSVGGYRTTWTFTPLRPRSPSASEALMEALTRRGFQTSEWGCAPRQWEQNHPQDIDTSCWEDLRWYREAKGPLISLEELKAAIQEAKQFLEASDKSQKLRAATTFVERSLFGDNVAIAEWRNALVDGDEDQMATVLDAALIGRGGLPTQHAERLAAQKVRAQLPQECRR